MKKCTTRLAMSAAVAVTFFSSVAVGQDPALLAPEVFDVRLENDCVRMLEFRGTPGDAAPMHSHPHYITYLLTDSKRRFTYPDGTVREGSAKAGDVFFRPPTTHAGENISDIEDHVLLVELKQGGGCETGAD